MLNLRLIQNPVSFTWDSGLIQVEHVRIIIQYYLILSSIKNFLDFPVVLESHQN